MTGWSTRDDPSCRNVKRKITTSPPRIGNGVMGGGIRTVNGRGGPSFSMFKKPGTEDRGQLPLIQEATIIKVLDQVQHAITT